MQTFQVRRDTEREITLPDDENINTLLFGRGREWWGDSRLSPTPKNTSTSHSPEKINGQDLMGGMVPTNNHFLPNRDNNLQGILGETVPESGAGSTVTTALSRDMKFTMLQLSGGTVQPNNFPPLQNQNEIESKNEEILKTANMEEGSELMNFRIDDKLIFTTEDSEIVPRKQSKEESSVIDYKRKTTSTDKEDSQFLLVTDMMLNTTENLQGSVAKLKPEISLKLSLNNEAQLGTAGILADGMPGVLGMGMADGMPDVLGMYGTMEAQFDMEQSGELLVRTGMEMGVESLNAEVGTGGGSAQYCGNIGIVNDECGTEMAGYEGDQLVTWKHEGKGDSMWRKSSRSEECLSPSLKQNLKLKSFGSGKKSGTGLSGMGTVVTGKYAQLRGGKLSKFKSSVLKEKIDLFEIFQGKNIVKAKKTEGLVTPIESKFNISVAGNDQDIPASRLRTNGSGAGEPWSLDLRPCGLGQEVRASQNLPEQN